MRAPSGVVTNTRVISSGEVLKLKAQVKNTHHPDRSDPEPLLEKLGERQHRRGVHSAVVVERRERRRHHEEIGDGCA